MTYIQYKKYTQNKIDIQRDFENILEKNGLITTTAQHWIYNISKKIILKTGFKIHLSATIQNANYIATLFFNYLKQTNLSINYKIVSSLAKLELQNSGVYGYSQTGKFITIYPKNNTELLYLLNNLENLFKGIKGIDIPSDFKYKLSEVVFYRYGEFIPDHSYVDSRNQEIPQNVDIPIPDFFIKHYDMIPDQYIILEVIKKTSKGGVYKALNFNSNKIVILKEAINLSNIDILNQDSVDRMFSEKNILSKIESEGFSPKILNEFYVKNSYFIELEFLEGKPLSKNINSVPLNTWIMALADYLDIINNQYFLTYRDLSFNNILVSKTNKIYLIDFEYALDKQLISQKNALSLYGTPGFYETDTDIQSNQPEDIFGLVSLLYWHEFFSYYKEFQKLNYEVALKKIREINTNRVESLDKSSEFYFVYFKAFTHSYTSFSELKADLETIFKKEEVKKT